MLLAAVGIGCGHLEADYGVEPGEVIPNHPAHEAYDELFPVHVEVFSVSQFRTLGGQTGGIPGHGVMYLRGACLDESASEPQLRLCDGREGESGGVGISVNRWTRNVNWLAFPGRELFFFGNLEPGQSVTEAALERAVDDALELGLFEGVDYYEYPTEVEQRSLRDFVRHHVLGTDFGIAMARTLLCARAPVSTDMMREVVTYLNDLNRQYAESDAEYHWSVYHDNCVHVLRNALAAASVWPPKHVRSMTLRQAFHVPIPANEYLHFALRTTEFPIEDFDAVWKDDEARDSLLEFGWLPGRHGALLTSVHALRPNHVYDTGFHLLVLEPPFGGDLHRAERLMNDRRFTDLETNLRWFQSHYRNILEAVLPDEGEELRGQRDRPVRRRYQRYVADQFRDVDAKLEQLRAYPAGSSSTAGL